MIFEALIIGIKEGFKIGIVGLVFYSILRLKNRTGLLKPFYASILSALLISAVSVSVLIGSEYKEYLSHIINMSFATIFIFSAASLFHAAGTNLIPSKNMPLSVATSQGFNSLMIFFFTFIYFCPDIIGSAILLEEVAVLKEAESITYLSAAAGFIACLSFFPLIARFISPVKIASFFDLPQFLLFLAIVKLFGGGIKGIAELSLIPSLQAGFMKFSHDFVHHTFVILMVPDHPLLQTTAWNFIALFFGPNFASIVSLFILLLFPLMFIYYSLLSPMPEPDVKTPAQKRKIKSLILSDRRKKALPVIAFVLIISISWFYEKGETVSRLYNPKSMPVVEDKGMILIPVKDPTMNLMDGRLHKFSLALKNEKITIMAIRKSKDEISICLDACEICPPEGYGQIEGHVVCIYCNTPIPIETLGEPGGCNPIPLSFSIDEKFIKISLDEILKKWEYVKSGQSKEAVR